MKSMDPFAADKTINRDCTQGQSGTAGIFNASAGLSATQRAGVSKETGDDWLNKDGGLAPAEKQKRKRPKVDEDLIVGKRGIPVILEELTALKTTKDELGRVQTWTDKNGNTQRKVRFRTGVDKKFMADNARKNLTKMLKIYREWGETMFMQLDFDTLMDKVEALGNKQKVKEFMYKARLERDDPERFKEEFPQEAQKAAAKEAGVAVGEPFDPSMGAGGMSASQLEQERMMDDAAGQDGGAEVEWVCGVCGTSNPGENIMCSMCNTERPASAPPAKPVLTEKEKRMARIAEIKRQAQLRRQAKVQEPSGAGDTTMSTAPVDEPMAEPAPAPQRAPTSTQDIRAIVESIDYRKELKDIIRHCDRDTMTAKGCRRILAGRFNIPPKAFKKLGKKDLIKSIIDEILQLPDFQAKPEPAAAPVDFGSRPISPATLQPANAGSSAMDLDLDIDAQAGTQPAGPAQAVAQEPTQAGGTDSLEFATTVDPDELADTVMMETQVQESLQATAPLPGAAGTCAETVPLDHKATPTDSQEW